MLTRHCASSYPLLGWVTFLDLRHFTNGLVRDIALLVSIDPRTPHIMYMYCLYKKKFKNKCQVFNLFF